MRIGIKCLLRKWLIVRRQHLVMKTKSNSRVQQWINSVYGKLCSFWMDDTSRWSPSHSSIVGSFSDPLTHVIHLCDAHLTVLHNFRVCSLFGRTRIHGHTLRPLTFYSVYNYRTNSPLAIEFDTSASIPSVPDVHSMIADVQLAERALRNVQQNGGDVLLMQNESNSDSTFLNIMREHRVYSKWFSEEESSRYVENPWRRFERDLNVRVIETTEQTAVIPREQIKAIVDRIIDRWTKEATEESPFVVLVCGEKDLGKSTFTRYLVNRALNHIDSSLGLSYIDCDLGQCEFTMGGCVSYVDVQSPLLGPPCSHIQSNPKPDRLLYYGFVSPQSSPVRYLQYVNKLRQMWNSDHPIEKQKRSMILVNTMGWGTGLGLELLKETVCMCRPNVIIQLADHSNTRDNRERMPDLTLEWLFQQPVYLPYRKKIQMTDKRQADYDGQVAYEYIKLESTVPNASRIGVPKLRPRDHRLLATWSYFFSSKPTRVRLPWSDLVHILLLNDRTNVVPDCLEQSIVALCSSENIEELRNLAVHVNGTFHLWDYRDQLFECVGFGWIERCDKETQTYEIFTPTADRVTDVTLLVSGTFDTPDEFKSMFKS